MDSPLPCPGLWLSPTEWAALPEKLADPFFQNLATLNRRALEAMARTQGASPEDLPAWLEDPAGRKAHYGCRAIKNRLQRAAVAWRLEGLAEDLSLAQSLVDYAVGQVGPHMRLADKRGNAALRADLHTGDLLYLLCFALEALGEALGEDRAERVRARLAGELLPLYLTGLREGDWWRHCDFNWSAALHGNAGLAALAISAHHPELAARVLAGVRDGLRYLLEAIPAGGGWIEGLMYQTTTLAHLTDFVAALHRATGDDLGLAENRDFRDTLDYRTQWLGGDGLPFNFSDCHERTCEWSLPHAYWWARRCARPDWAGFEDLHPKPWQDTAGVFQDVEAFWFRDCGQPSQAPAVSRGLRHFPGLDWAVWRGDRAWLAVRSGFVGGNRGNRDLGQFIFGHGPDRFLIDPGYEAARTDQHNCVTVRGQEVTDCARARLIRRHPWPGGLYLCCDLSEAFPHSLAYYHRHWLVLDDDRLLLLDDLHAAGGRRVSARYHLQTRGAPQPLPDGFLLPGSTGALRVRFLAPVMDVEVLPWTWGGGPVHTLRWRDRRDTPHVLHPVLFSRTDDPVEVRRENDLCRVRAGHRHWTIDLAEGALQGPEDTAPA